MDCLQCTTWTPRGQCGTWPVWLEVAYIAANLTIFVAYQWIPTSLRRGSKAGFNIGTRLQTRCWIAFIRLCGLGHLVEGCGAFLWANYYAFTVLHWVTAVVSILTAATFPAVTIRAVNRLRELEAGVLATVARSRQ